MLSSLLRPKKGRQRVQEHSPFSSFAVDQSSPLAARHVARHATADFTTDNDDEDTEEDEDVEEEDENAVEEMDGEDDEDGEEDTPLLPIFSAAHLGN